MNSKQWEILEERFTNIYKYDETAELEAWTDGGVDMIITINLDKDIVTELEDYIENFDIDEEIDLYRGDKEYRKVFTIRESLKDFEDWIKHIKGIIKELKEAK